MRVPRPVLGSLLAVSLVACTKTDPPDNTFDSDTGLPECGRVRGTAGILMFDAANVDTLHAPVDQPDATRYATGVAGPLADGLSFVTVQAGAVSSSADGGCNWGAAGTLPSDGWWQLRSAGDDIYAFDRDEPRGAHSTDAGQSWAPFTTPSQLVQVPVIASADAAWLRGVTATGVLSSTDGGASWTPGGNLPDGAAGLLVADLSGDDLDHIVAGTELGLVLSQNGGDTWADSTPALLEHLNIASLTVHAVAMSADDANVLAAIVSDPTGLRQLVRSPDGGATWQRLADSDGIGLDGQSGLWIVPGDPTKVVTTWIDTSAGAQLPLSLNVSVPDSGTHTVRSGWFYGLTQMVFGGERWVAAVHGVPPT